MDATKIGITGGRGMLGSDLRVALEKHGFETLTFDLPETDITRAADIEEIVASSDVVVNCAAYTAVDRAENDLDACRAVNATAPGELGKAAAAAGKRVIHISTDFVFGDAGNEPLREDSATNPLSVYGSTKLEGERAALESGADCAVLRVQWTYGRGGANFVSKIAELAEKLPTLKVVDDQIGSPTHTVDAARAILSLIRNKARGVFHFAAEGYASRFDVAILVLDELNIDTPLTPCSSGEFPAPAERPRNSRFECSKIDTVLDFKRPHWKNALRTYLRGAGNGDIGP